MHTDNDDLEQKCEDALFELCDVRERFPSKSAAELERCLRLSSRINMKPIKPKVAEKVDNICLSNEQQALLAQVIAIPERQAQKWEKLNHRLSGIAEEINNWGIILEQLKRSETYVQ